MYDNPFSHCTSKDMTYKEVVDYWCSPFLYCKDEGLNENDLLTLATPIIIEGAKGTGKTMILKYLSYHCQKTYYNKEKDSDLFSYFKEKGSIGIYLRYKDDFYPLFTSLYKDNQDTDKKAFIFHYNLLIITEILKILKDLFDNSENNYEVNKLELIENLSKYFSIEFQTLEESINYIDDTREEFDNWLNSYYRSRDTSDFPFTMTYDAVKLLMLVVKKSIQEFRDILFIIIIDEYENVNTYQRILNTLIKKVDSDYKVTYRIGVRPESFYTLETDLGNEVLQHTRDYVLTRLVFPTNNKYKEFLRVIAQRRLEKSSFFAERGINNIENVLGEGEDLEEEARQIVKKSTDNFRHFDLIATQPFKSQEKAKEDREMEERAKREENRKKAERAKRELVCNKPKYNPLLEMMNVVWVLRGNSIDETKERMKEYLAGDLDRTSKYRRDYVDKYKYQLVLSLLKIYSKNGDKLYYSFTTFSFLSSGSVNDFISLCRNTFFQLDDDYYKNIVNAPLIPSELQRIGALKTASNQLDIIRKNNENGTEMALFILNIGELFSFIHKECGLKYPETTQFAFENESEIIQDKNLKIILNRLLKWGVIIKKPMIQSISIGQHKGNIYYLNHIFAPIFNISYRIRGGYNPILSTELFKKMLYHPMNGKDIHKMLVVTKKKRTISRSQKTLDL